jgi:hypothetical protein
MPTKAERDANLDILKTEVETWFRKESERLDNESKFLKAVMQGRGSTGAATKNLAATSKLVQDEIDAFLLLD